MKPELPQGFPGTDPRNAAVAVRVVAGIGPELEESLPRWNACVSGRNAAALSRHPAWLTVLARAFQHQAYCLEATAGDKTVGLLPLCDVKSLLFGRFLVSLPYLNSGGVLADSNDVGRMLVDSAVALADRLNVRYLELRHEEPLEHPALNATLTSKVHMRLELPDSSETLWKQLGSKLRNGVRRGEKYDFSIHWGGQELLRELYQVFAHNMRDLGTPVFSQNLFASILSVFPDRAEIAVVRQEKRPIAAALLLHGNGVTEVPSASSLREFNSTNANTLMYWHLLCRAVERRQQVFDFGRSSVESNTYAFKKQWGAKPAPATWQYHVRQGKVDDMRRESGKYARFVAVWQRLPLGLTRLIGPPIVRGIP